MPLKWEKYRKRPEVEVVEVLGPMDARTSLGTLGEIDLAEAGDYIVLGTHGEMYPVSPDSFAESFERVEGGGEIES